MTTFKLTKIENVQIGKFTEKAFTYVSEDGKDTLKFCADPEVAWSWNIFPKATTLKARARNKLIDAHIIAAMQRGEKSFEEAVATLSI